MEEVGIRKVEMMDFICPICMKKVRHSEYLHSVFPSQPYSEWVANLTTHYRHEHISYYDKSWRSWAYASKSEYKYMTHDDFKAKVNNRAKRQLIRAIQRTTWNRTIKRALIEGFRGLQSNDKETIEMIDKCTQRLSMSKGYLKLEDFGVLV